MSADHKPFGWLRESIGPNRFRIIAWLVSVCAFIIIWQEFAWFLRYTGVEWRFYVPYPAEVFEVLVESFVEEVPGIGLSMGTMALASLKRVILGFILALAVAFPLGLLIASFSLVKNLGDPIVEMFRPVPPVAWIPIFIVMFSMFWGPVAVVFLGAFFPILLNVVFGVQRTDRTLIDAAKTLGAGRIDVLMKVVIPSTAPYLMTGIKIGLGIGWMCIVAAEMLPVVGGGVGYALWTSALQFSRYDVTFACMIVIGLLSIMTTGIAEQVERRLYRWMGMA
jgi:ABC-type nitrate/sulfonate/bicarbonate transport system permease component